MNLKKHFALLTLLFFSVVLSAQVKEKMITISFSKIPLSEAMARIEKTSGYTFFYDATQVNVKQEVSLNVKQVPVSKAVGEMLKGIDLSFEVTSTQIALFPKKSTPAQTGKATTIIGKVVDENGEPIIGANVLVAGTTTGVITDIDGNYKLEAPFGSSLQISYIGYTTQTVKAGQKSIIKMKEDSKTLEEVVVVGYGVMKKKDPTGMILSEDESTAILLNGDDHVRIQTLQTGLTLEQLYERADKIDDYISERFDYAFDEKYGYLTSFPTNVGTGLRAAVVLHLPMLSKNKNFNSLVADMGRFGTQVRGVYGEGAENFGSLYQISNQKTLGQTEREIIDIVRKAALELDVQERRVRREYRQRKPVQAADECYKSYGVLKYARRLTRKDGMEFLSQIMTGITDGILKVKEPYSVYGLMLGIQPANLLSLADRPLDKDELDAARAEFLRRRLPEIIEIEN